MAQKNDDDNVMFYMGFDQMVAWLTGWMVDYDKTTNVDERRNVIDFV